MTHMRPLADEEGDFADWQESATPCRHCGSPHVQYRVWESLDGGYEDYQYRCAECQRAWWVDGIDS
jgi:hypothetical protein